MNLSAEVWQTITPDVAAEAAADLRADIAARKAELQTLEQERDEALASERYGEDYEGAMYSKPERYRLDCGCVYYVRTAVWERACVRHEDLR